MFGNDLLTPMTEDEWDTISRAKRAAYMRGWRAKQGPEFKTRQSIYHSEYRSANLLGIVSQQKLYRAGNRDNILEKKRIYAARTRVKKAVYDAEYRIKNRDRIVQWRKDNPDIIAQHHRNRRALLKAAEGVHTKEEIRHLLIFQNGLCAYCKTDITPKFDADHIVPLVKGGSNWISNIQLLCKQCNNRKRSTDAEEFAKAWGFVP